MQEEKDARDRDRVAIVTGAGSGIGRAAAVRLAAEGYHVTLAGRRQSMLEQTAGLIAGPPAVTAPCDVTDAESVNAMITATVAAFGRIDVVVNNAGMSRTAPIGEVSIDLWREVMAVDVESIVLVTQAALPFLLRGGGSVVNVASVAGLGGDHAMTAYNAAKGAVVNLTRSLAVELAARDIRVNAVADIPADDIAAFVSRIPMGRAAEPAEVADVIAFLAGRDARFVTGVVIPVDGGLRAGSGQPRHR